MKEFFFCYQIFPKKNIIKDFYLSEAIVNIMTLLTNSYSIRGVFRRGKGGHQIMSGNCPIPEQKRKRKKGRKKGGRGEKMKVKGEKREKAKFSSIFRHFYNFWGDEHSGGRQKNGCPPF